MRRTFLPSSFLAAPLLAWAVTARAEPPPQSTQPRPHAYAVVVGTNAGGAGQGTLRYAEDDARRVAQVLRELGHFAGSDVRVLLHPGRSDLLAAVDDVANKTRADAARGEQSELVFYYSGHARASGLDLGGDELSLSVLREKLSSIPASLTLVVLDACQSGAMARVKGAEPAADFTYNSVSRLTQKGLAIMASSSEKELSQESDELKGSYFTHHLVTGLRGPGDADGDGRVSLDEAYRYAYRNTLASTARTQVGEQHVTLETDLAGQGDVPLTYPVDARAQLELPGPLDGRVLVQHRASGSVVAEVQKAPGAAVRLAFVAGSYEAVVGQRGTTLQCRLDLMDDRVTVLDASRCTRVVVEAAQAKGGKPSREVDRWAVEGSVGLMSEATDAFTNRLQTFGYQPQGLGLPSGRYAIGASRWLAPHLSGVIEFTRLSGQTYERNIGSSTDTASMNAYGVGIYVRASADVVGRWLGVYGQAGGGLSLGFLHYQTQATDVPPSTTTTYASYLLGGAIGMTARLQRVPLTFFVQGAYDRAPAITDLIGDTHDSGGFSFALGLRVRLGDGS